MADRRKNVLMIIPNFGFGGAERSFANVSLELAKQFNVFVVAFNRQADHVYPHGGTVLDLGVEAGKNVADKLYKFWQRVQKLKRLKKQHAIDVSISFLEGADYVNLLSKGREKVVISIRGSKIFDEEISGLTGRLRKELLIPRLYRRADRIVTLSEGLKSELVDQFKQEENRIETIYNFFDVASIQALAAEPLEEKYASIFENRVIINTGRLHIQKEQEGLLQVFARLAPAERGKLVFIGDGPLRDSLIAAAKALGLSVFWWGQSENMTGGEDVYFLGFQKNPYQFMKHASLFAFSSSWEGFGNVLLEAMISGLPVITTDCPSGPREIVAPDTNASNQLRGAEFAEYGILMPLLNGSSKEEAINVWAGTLQKLMADKELIEDYRKRSETRVGDFTREKIALRWVALIRSLS